MAEQVIDEREQFRAHFAKIDDAAGDRSPFDAVADGAAQVESSNPAPSSEPAVEPHQDEPKGDEPAVEPKNEPASDPFKDGEPKGDEPKGDQPAPKEDSAYKKAQRGRERLEDIRKQVEIEKAQAKADREAAERLRQQMAQEIEAMRRRPQQQTNDLTEGGRFSAEEFERASEHFEREAEKAVNEGDLEKYNEALKQARQTRNAARATRQREAQLAEQRAKQEFARQYGEAAEKIIKEHPDLGKESEMSRRMIGLLNQYPVLQMHPQGFQWAWELMQMQDASGDLTKLTPEQRKTYDESGKAAGLLEKLTKLEAEVKRLTGKTSLESGIPAPISSSTPDVNALSLDKQREHFRAAFARADDAR